MKKPVIVMCLVLAAMLSVCACAQTISRQANIDMESVISECTLHVGFAMDSVSEQDLYADVYDTVNYDIAAISALEVGDVIETGEGDVTVESIDKDEYGSVLINGGMDEGGVTLFTEEDTNGFVEMSYEQPAMVLIGQAQFGFADEVTINVYKMDEDMGIADEGYDTVQVPASEVKGELQKIAEKMMSDEFSPYQVTIVIGAEHIINEITFDYMP